MILFDLFSLNALRYRENIGKRLFLEVSVRLKRFLFEAHVENCNAGGMSVWIHVIGWLMVAVNTLCLLRLGILPVIFLARNYKLYGKIFWVALFVATVFLMSEVMLIRMLVNLEVK